MQRAPITWLVLARDLGSTFKVDDAGDVHIAMVLDVDTGLVRGVALQEQRADALAQAFSSALTMPAADLPPGTPSRVLCDLGLRKQVRTMLGAAGVRPQVPVQEVSPGPEAEDIFDSLVAHLSGRGQPSEPPTTGDWELLMHQALGYRQAEPWVRWGDDRPLLVEMGRLGHDGQPEQHIAVVMGQAGIQHGLALYPGPELPAALRSGSEVAAQVTGTVLLLDRSEEVPPDVPGKAQRYGWPSTDALVPAFLSLTGDGPQDLDQHDAHLLTIALAAVNAFDGRGLRSAGAEDTADGTVTLADGDTLRWSITPAPAEEPSGLRLHLGGSDLLPPDTAVTLGHLPRPALPELRKTTQVHRPGPVDAPGAAGKELALLVLSPAPGGGAALTARLAELDPIGVSCPDTGRGEHAVVLLGIHGAEVVLTLPTGHAAVSAFRRRQRQAKGHHLVMVADLGSAKGEGQIYGLFECHQPIQAAGRAPSPKRRR